MHPESGKKFISRPKNFVESKLKTQVESEGAQTDIAKYHIGVQTDERPQTDAKTQTDTATRIDSKNKSTQTSLQSVDSVDSSIGTVFWKQSPRILALEKKIIELEKTLHSKEIMIEEILADPVQFI